MRPSPTPQPVGDAPARRELNEGAPRSPFAIGVDLGGTTLRVGAVDASGECLERLVLPSHDRDRDALLDALCDAVSLLSLRHRHVGRRYAGVGVGVPGILDARAGVLREAPSLPAWKGFAVRDALARRLGEAVVLDNDANVAAVGEQWRGAARGARGVCMLTLGTGIGGGLVLDGQVFRGTTGMAAEFGHMTVRPDGPRCGCGNRGCLEQYASASAVARRALGSRELAPRLVDVPNGDVARHVCALGAGGDREARALFRDLGVTLGIGLAGLINALNLPVYVVGGGVSAAWDLFARAMFSELRSRSFVYRQTGPRGGRATDSGTRVVRAAFPSEAGVIGAARLALLAAGVVEAGAP